MLGTGLDTTSTLMKSDSPLVADIWSFIPFQSLMPSGTIWKKANKQNGSMSLQELHTQQREQQLLPVLHAKTNGSAKVCLCKNKYGVTEESLIDFYNFLK